MGDAAPATASRFVWPAYTLAEREVTRFLRQRSRLIGALGQPIIFWVLFGVGFSGSFALQGDKSSSYQEYFVPGVAAMIVLFTAIFSTISIIEDRHEGFLQGVLVSPASRSAIVAGKLLGGTALAVLQAVVFLALAVVLPKLGLAPEPNWSITFLSGIGIILWLVLMGLGMTGLGYLLAYRTDSVQGFHSMMSVLLFPMWLMSGAFFPATGSEWMQWVIRLNPLTYGVAGLRRLMYDNSSSFVEGLPSWPLCLGVTILFALVMAALDVRITRRS
jgi:ABC-2 type transport system permease protein